MLRRRSAGHADDARHHLDIDLRRRQPNPGLDVPDYYAQARRALRTDRRRAASCADDELVLAERIADRQGRHYVVVLVQAPGLRRLGRARRAEPPSSRRPAPGCGIALLLGIGLATTLLRRLERLREADARARAPRAG